jgi:hypothetical protein
MMLSSFCMNRRYGNSVPVIPTWQTVARSRAISAAVKKGSLDCVAAAIITLSHPLP